MRWQGGRRRPRGRTRAPFRPARRGSPRRGRRPARARRRRTGRGSSARPRSSRRRGELDERVRARRAEARTTAPSGEQQHGRRAVDRVERAPSAEHRRGRTRPRRRRSPGELAAAQRWPRRARRPSAPATERRREQAERASASDAPASPTPAAGRCTWKLNPATLTHRHHAEHDHQRERRPAPPRPAPRARPRRPSGPVHCCATPYSSACAHQAAGLTSTARKLTRVERRSRRRPRRAAISEAGERRADDARRVEEARVERDGVLQLDSPTIWKVSVCRPGASNTSTEPAERGQDVDERAVVAQPDERRPPRARRIDHLGRLRRDAASRRVVERGR